MSNGVVYKGDFRGEGQSFEVEITPDFTSAL